MDFEKKKPRFVRTFTDGYVGNEIWLDRETGVNYLFHASGTAAGMVPLYGTDGKIVITQDCENAEPVAPVEEKTEKSAEAPKAAPASSPVSSPVSSPTSSEEKKPAPPAKEVVPVKSQKEVAAAKKEVNKIKEELKKDRRKN